MSHFKRNLITTALPYANGPVHIGHLAGVYVPADIYVRYLRAKGDLLIVILHRSFFNELSILIQFLKKSGRQFVMRF